MTGALLRLAFIVTSLLAACGESTLPSPPSSSTIARFDLDALGAGELLAVPFPSDLHRDAAGAIAIGTPPGTLEPAVLESIHALAARRRGFCTTCAVFFALDGALDRASVPADAEPSRVALATDALVLVDVDPESPERGRFVPLRAHLAADGSLLAVRPVRGIVLARDRRYAVALTNRLRGDDGLPLSPSPDFAAVRDGRTLSPEQTAAAAVIDPALDELERIGLARAEVVALAAFTTDDPTLVLQRARSLVSEGAAPVARVDRVWTAAELDDLLGTPSEPRPGTDVPPAAGTEGTRATRHETTAFVVLGTFDAPRLVEGVGTEVGALRVDAEGEIVAGPRESVPFVLIVPDVPDVSSLPVVLSHHGFNSSRSIGFVLADTAGRAGAAVLAIDAYQHGDRAASAVDELFALRGEGVPGPDGLAETNPLDVSARVFGASGVAPGTELLPAYPLGALLQLASDAMSALRFLREGDLAAIQMAAPELASLSFDTTRIFIVGNSLGAEVTTAVLSVERGVAGAVLNVLPGAIVDNLVDSPEFRPLTETLFLPLIGLHGPFTEPERGLGLDVVIDLIRYSLEPIDPYALAPYVLRDPVSPGAPPDLLVQLAGLDEVASRAAGEATVAALGIPAVPDLAFAQAETGTLPVRENFETSAGAATAVAVRFDVAGHGMLEVLGQESRYEPPVLPPFTRRAAPMSIENPLVDVHAQIEELLRTRIAEGRATIR